MNGFSLDAPELAVDSIGSLAGGLVAILAVAVLVVCAGILIELAIEARNKRIIVRPGAFAAAVEQVPGSQILWRVPPVGAARRIDLEGRSDASTANFEKNAANVAVALQGADFIGSTIEAWHSVSENVMSAVAQMTHHDINSFADLFAVAHENGYKLATDGFFNSLRGHTSEFQTYHDFSAWQPAVPIDSNNPGVDLFFGPHGVANVKVVGDAGPALAEHFEKYPHVAAILNRDAANIPHDALYFDPAHGLDPSILDHANHLTIVDTALTAAGIGEQTSHAIDLLQNPLDTQFPYIGLAVVTGSQAALWIRGKKTAAQAVEDTAVIGVGLIAGLKAGAVTGALAGSLIPGPGTLVGGIVGGIGGLVAGKHLGVRFTERRLRESEQVAKDKSNQLREAYRVASEEADAEWRSIMNKSQVQLTNEIDVISEEVKPALFTVAERDKRRNAIYVADLKNAVHETHQELCARLGRLRLWALVNPLARRRLAAYRQDLDTWVALQSTAGQDISRLADLLAALPSNSNVIGHKAEALVAIRTAHYREIEDVAASAIEKTLRVRVDAVSRLNVAFEKLTLKIEKQMKPAVEAFHEALESFKYYKSAAGK